MNSLNRKILVISIVISLITTYLIYNFLSNQSIETSTIEYRDILVAATNISPRTEITEEMIKEIEVDINSYTPNFINSREEIIGKYTKDTILTGEGFISDRLMAENKIDLSLRIPKDKRAVTIAVDQFSGVSDLMKPGDYVDIYLTAEGVKNGGIIEEQLTKLFLQKVQILAIDKEQFRTDNQRAETPGVFSVTLALTPKEGERVAFGENIGSFKLALRPLESEDVIKTPGATKKNIITN